MSPKIDLYYQQQQQQQQKHHQHHQHQHQIPKPCPHLADFQSRYGHKPFRALQKCLRVKPLGRAAIRRDPLEVPRCGTCGDSSRPRLYACVACASIFCHSLVTSSHAAAHALSSPGHEIAVDVDRAELFCCACCDQVYDRDFDASVVLAQTEATTLGGGGGGGGSSSSSSVLAAAAAAAAASPENLRKRRRVVDYRPWTPDFEEQMMMGNGSSPMQTSVGLGVSSNYLPWGLRGLNNLGNTCFMNSVLQALLHTPPLRNYFLSDRHNQYVCQTNKNHIVSSTSNADTKMNKDNSNNSRLCMGCDMDAMFSAVFSGGDRRPYSPAKLLYSWWQHASNLASYEQQDAHEFFISVLDGIHEKVEKDKRKPQSQGNGDCCIAHRVFSGLLRSDVTCMACGFTSTTYDPCVDISLDLEPNHGGSMKKASTKSHHVCTVESDSKTTQNPGISTLVGCLDRFTRPEKLGSDQKFFCQQCQVRQESLKQMSIRKLPLVSCFHIKRFEHSSTRKMSRKVDRYLQFPFSLDMSPYLSSSILTSRFGNRLFTYGSEPDPSNELSSEFELFAVVTHTGGLDAGHYVTYLRLNDQWYKCDDAWITQVNESIVRAAQGYMMFYVQKILYYKASESLAAS